MHFIDVARCNVAEASQNAYLVLIVYHYLCLKRSDQSYNSLSWLSRVLMSIVILIRP